MVSETFEFSKHIIRRGVRKIEFWVLENLRVGIKEIRGLGTLTGRLLDRRMVKGRGMNTRGDRLLLRKGMNTRGDRLLLRRGQICMCTSIVMKLWWGGFRLSRVMEVWRLLIL